MMVAESAARHQGAGRPVHLRVDSSGAGPPIVLLHGFALHGGLFAPLAAALAAHQRVHVVDLPGHGGSGTVEPFDLPTLASTVDHALSGIAPPLTVLGWSLGGQVAMQWAVARPDRVHRLVLVSTTPSFVARHGWPSGISEALLARFGDELRTGYAATLRRFLTLQVQGSDDGRRTLLALRQRLLERGEPSREALHGALTLVVGADLRSMLRHVSVPALVIGGDRDLLVPLAATEALATALPNAIHRTISGAAHAPFLSHPQAFARALEGFVGV